MLIKATEQQIKEMMAKACNASTPMGLGMLHYDADTNFKPDDFDLIDGYNQLDYVQGRMIKLDFERKAEDLWKSYSFPPRLDYQSWATEYPDNNLILSVGAEVVEE